MTSRVLDFLPGSWPDVQENAQILEPTAKTPGAVPSFFEDYFAAGLSGPFREA